MSQDRLYASEAKPKRTPTRRKLVYAIMCHANCEWVAEQFRLLWSPQNIYLYHVDEKAPQALHRLAAALANAYSNVSLLPSRLCSWAGFSLVDVMLDLVGWAVRKDTAWTHLIFLSEQHLPLVSNQVVLERLDVGTSYFVNLPFRSFSGVPAADLLHRVSGEYVEVPGVGGFETRARVRRSELLSILHHGSQWMVLSYPACYALAQDHKNALWEQFRTTLLADETAIQTWFEQHRSLKVRRRVNRSTTLVAAPIDGGNPDMTFTESAFFRAVSDGFLFIRKRPVVIPESVHTYLSTCFPDHTHPAKVHFTQSTKTSIFHSDHLIDATFLSLNGALASRESEFVVARVPSTVPGPPFFGIVQGAGLSESMSVFVMSGDLSCFKVAAISKSASDDYLPGVLGAYRTTSLKVRGWGIWHHREVHLGVELNCGIVTMSSFGDFLRLAAIIETYVSRSLTLDGYG